MTRWQPVVLSLMLMACGTSHSTSGTRTVESGTTSPHAPTKPPSGSGQATEPKPIRPSKPTLFHKRKTGWKGVDDKQRRRIDDYAASYLRFLSESKTPRRAVSSLTKLFSEARQLSRTSKVTAKPGDMFWFAGIGGKAAAFVRVGQHTPLQGMNIVVVSVDAPRIDLKQRPAYRKADLAMFDTLVYGPVDLKAWLSRPLALYMYIHRGNGRRALDLDVGDKPADPVLVIPDLLPHLARHVQRKQIVDDAERMDAVAAKSLRGLEAFLATHDVTTGLLSTAEASLVPAGPAVLVGVDRARIAGYGHNHRALAYAAVRALAQSPTPHRTACVIVLGKAHTNYSGTSGLAFVNAALTRIASELAGKQDPDILDIRRMYARSQALISHHTGGKFDKGVVLNPRSDDALPRATRKVIDAFRASGAQYQIISKRAWGHGARELGTLDLDTVDIGLPVSGTGTPTELLSVLDLYQAHVGLSSWFGLQS